MKKARCIYCCADCGKAGFWLTRAEVRMLLDEALTVRQYPPNERKRGRVSAAVLWSKLETFYQLTAKRDGK